MSVSKRLSAVLQRWMGTPPAPKKSEADEHLARIEMELAAMRARLRTLESRADALYSDSQQKPPAAAAPTTAEPEKEKPPPAAAPSQTAAAPPVEEKPKDAIEPAKTLEPAEQVAHTSAMNFAAELSANAPKQTASTDTPSFSSAADIASFFTPVESVDEARKIKEQHEINRAAEQLMMSLNPNLDLEADSSSSSSSCSSSSASSSASSASSSAASSPPGSPKQAPLDLGDLDALLKGVNTQEPAAGAADVDVSDITVDSSMDLMAALDSLSGIPGEKPAAPAETKDEKADAVASLAGLDLPDLSALDNLAAPTADLGNLGDLSALGDLSGLDAKADAGSMDLGDLGDLSSLTTDLSALDALAGLDSLAGLGGSSAAAPEQRPLVRDHYEAEDTNVAGLRRGKKKPTLQGRGAARFAMEDAHAAVYPFNHSVQQAFFGVFDGFAGRDCAEDATKALPKALADNIEAVGLSADLTAIWPKVFADADEALRKHEYVGCTCTSVFVWEFEGERYVQAANVGDSNVYLFRGDKAIMLNTEHKVTSAEERKRIQAMGIEMTAGQTRINGVAVARALGTHFIKDEKLGIVSTPSVSSVYKLQSDDHFLVIASDGLWDVISGQDACEMVRDLPDASAMATTLLKHAVKCTKCVDNVTVVVIRL